MENWKESLVRYFAQGAKDSKTAHLGAEVEHFILDSRTRTAVPYSGDKGIRQVLTRLMQSWPEAEILPDNDFFGFQVPEFTITLEPASQLEISIAPSESVSWIGNVYRSFLLRLEEVLSKFGYTAVHAGCQPTQRVSDLELIPKKRYDLMNRHFQSTGTGGMEMMRGTASLQVSIDYQSEEDFRRKIQAAYYYGPVLKLLCDNAASFQGVPLKTHLKRTDIWRRTDPARCGILPGIFSPSYGFEDYAAFLGTIPPIFLKAGQEVLPTGERTVAELYEGKSLREEELTHILSMAFPDVRLKQYLEIRFADSVPSPYMEAYCALIKGSLYSGEGLSHAQEQIRSRQISEEMLRETEDDLMQNGFDGSVFGQPCREAAAHLLQLAKENLPEEEKAFLDPFDAVIRYGGIRSVPANGSSL